MTLTAPPPARADALRRGLASWLPGRRWFAGKGRPFLGPQILHRTPLAAAVPGAAWRAEVLVVRVSHSQVEAPDHYLVPVAMRHSLPPGLEDSLIARDERCVVYDALADPQIVRDLVDGLLKTRPGQGEVAFRRGGAVGDTGLPLGEARVLSGEQSNTSVVLGDEVVLKVFRRLRQGENPESEVLRLLTEAGQPHVPPLLGDFEGPLGEGRATYGILQRFLPDAADGWALALAGAGGAPAPAGGAGPGDGFPAEAFRLGEAVAAVHRTLAEAAPTTRLSREDLRAAGERMRARLEAAVRLSPGLRTIAPSLAAAFAGLAASGPGVLAQRLHGDLHLGQTLRTRTGWSLIDFEGEPDSPLAHRRALHPVAKDIAGMLRSFDYAAHHGLLRAEPPAAERRDLQEAARAWAARSQEAFCEGYARAAGADPREHGALLRAYLVDKAVYELVYEIRNRPGWASLPMRALERLSRGAGTGGSPL
ncbi:maltokinase N-terminal cap-like domain-containing protein [Streptomyces hoynatensis]|uniref:Maltokinase n=1 Tax=Streptomyces hoynatensis TaxID=1141874 RepID=A0A3A9YI95_9ACTN|nr:hypothetical protein [Streptomyces hoynatensis]RKN36691.1 hypothetical protein D7294_29890 [Streptomyces hoynatensis]